MQKKGQTVAFIWVFFMLMLLVSAFMYIVLSKPQTLIADSFEEKLQADYLTTFNKLKGYWVVWPIIVVISLIIWMYSRVIQSRESGPLE